jgi:hypothetical protein
MSSKQETLEELIKNTEAMYDGAVRSRATENEIASLRTQLRILRKIERRKQEQTAKLIDENKARVKQFVTPRRNK